jgi:hypothetical protein
MTDVNDEIHTIKYIPYPCQTQYVWQIRMYVKKTRW